MARIKRPARATTNLRRSPAGASRARAKKFAASGTKALASLPLNTPERVASFLTLPQRNVHVGQPLRPFVVVACNIPAATLRDGTQPYRAALAVYINNTSIQLPDPLPVVEHTECPASAGREKRRLYFIFEDIRIYYPGQYTVVASIFGPGNDVNGRASMVTPPSMSLDVVVQGSRRPAIQRPDVLDRLVYHYLGIDWYGVGWNPLETEEISTAWE
ncbi:hypothetical protein VTJ83DRAFT_2515 [Remersonia thermophila]|uniref:Capsid protein n=1 Tax=Remersonia thermophila TaxID=72144 RepID=A0ABR4DIX5_9PEZI